MTEGPLVDIPDISIHPGASGKDDTELTLLEGMERNTTSTAQRNRGNKLETAKRLGIGRQTLYTKIKAYSIDV